MFPSLVVGLPAPGSAPSKQITPPTASAEPTKLVFLHPEESGGTSLTAWMASYYVTCMHGKEPVSGTIAQTELDFGRPAVLSYDDYVDPQYSLPEQEDPDAVGKNCGPATRVCEILQKDGWQKDDCFGHVQHMVDAGCTFVSLHHFDIGVVNAFRSHGYKAITLMREPAARLKSHISKTAKPSGGEMTCCDSDDPWQEQLKRGIIGTPDIPLQYLTACKSMWLDWEQGCMDDERLRSAVPAAYAAPIQKLATFANSTYCFAKDRFNPATGIQMPANAFYIGQGGIQISNPDSEPLGETGYDWVEGEEAAKRVTGWADAAIDTLGSFDFVGTLENMDSVWPALAAKYGMTEFPHPPIQVMPDFSGENTVQFTAEEEQWIETNLQMDTRVYCHAVARHQSELQALGLPSFDTPPVCAGVTAAPVAAPAAAAAVPAAAPAATAAAPAATAAAPAAAPAAAAVAP